MRLLAIALLSAALLPGQAGRTNAPKPTAGTAATVRAPSYLSLKYPPMREVKLPHIDEYTLSNGIHVYLMENHELPLIGGFALVRTGALFDPPGKTGLGEITGSVIRTGGTTSRTGDEIDRMLENVAASVESSVSTNTGRIGFSCLKENTDQVLAIFKDVLMHPAFRQDKIDLLKGQYRGGIARRNDDAGGIAGREFTRLIYGPDSPFGRQVEYSDLDNIHRDDLVAFYNRYYFPANTIIAVQGDFSSAEMKTKLETITADWTVRQPPVPDWPQVNAKASPGLYLATKTDVTQTFFELGHLGGLLNDPDYPALEVMSDILGGGFSSRLFKNVRTREGLAYNIGASWGAGFTRPGTFTVGGSTKSASTVDAIKAAEEEIANIRTAEVTDEELKTSKDTVLNSFVFNFDSPSKTLGRLITYEYNHYPKDFIFQYQKAIEKVTKADVLRVAKQYIHPEQLTVVAVGKPADFGKPLTTLGAVKNLDLTIPEPKKVAASSTPETVAKGKEILSRAQAALGGAGKLAAVKDLTESLDAEMHMGQGAMKATQTTQIIFPSVFRQTQQLPFGKVVVYSDGTTGWMVTPQGPMAMPEGVLKQVRGETFRQIVNVFGNSRNATVNAVGDNAVEISEAGDTVRIDFDPTTNLPLKMQYQSAGMGTGPAEVVESYSDWKEVDGVKFPMHTVIEQAGQKFADVTVRDLKINSSLSREELSKKP